MPRVAGAKSDGKKKPTVASLAKKINAMSMRAVPRSIKGRGDYFYTNPKMKDISHKEFIGEGLARVGNAALPLISKITGYGDYASPQFNVKKNDIMSAMLSNGPPSFVSNKNREFTFMHREYLGDVSTGAANTFNITSYPLQPGLYQTFPWLSAIAQQFEQYRIDGMVFEFKSTSADALNSVTTSLGSIIIATEYDALSINPFATKQQMENHEFCSSARQSCSILHPIECDPKQSTLKQMYIRTGAVPAGGDIRMYDFGTTYVATTGQQGSNVNIGELWISYRLTFFKPQESSPGGYELLMDHWYNPTGTGISNLSYFGGANCFLSTGSSIGTTQTTNLITFPSNVSSGTFKVDYILTAGAGAATGTIGVTITNGSLAANPKIRNTTLGFANSTGTNCTAYFATYFVTITGPSATIAFGSGAALPTSINTMDLYITEVNSNVQ